MTRHCSSAALAASLMLIAGCNQRSALADGNQTATNTSAALPALPASLPMQSGAATPVAAAPPVTTLPVVSRPPLRRLADPRASYAYLDRAASYDDAVGDSPPDYAFGYDGVNPWGWQADDGSVEYAEPVDGGYRYYYYEPGAPTPYLVRDPGYSYAFDGLALIAIYDHGGRVLPPGEYGPRWDYAGRYFARARALRDAAAERRGVVAADWAARRAQISASNAAWDAARARDSAWAAYHAQVAANEQSHWQAERASRVEATRSFADYQHRGFAGPPPAPPQAAPPAQHPPAAMAAAQPTARPGPDQRFTEHQQAAAQRQQALVQTQQADRERTQQHQQAVADQRQQAQAQRAAAASEQHALRQQADARRMQANEQHAQADQARRAQAAQRSQAANEQRTAHPQQEVARQEQRRAEPAPQHHGEVASMPHVQPASHPQPAPEARPHPEAPHPAPAAPHPPHPAGGGGGQPHEHEHH